MRIPTPIIDLSLVVTPFLLGFLETKITNGSMIFDALDKITSGEKIILYILTFLLVEIIDYKFSYNRFVEKTQLNIDNTAIELRNIRGRLDGLQSKVELINHGQQIDNSLNNVKHPYFVNLITKRLKNLLSKNSELFMQTERTSPSHAHTFGAKGIRSTRENLKCVSYIPEYWEDKNDTEYMDTQVNLMKRGVKIKRLFIVNDANRENSIAQMKLQNKLGIETKFINQSMVEEEFKEKDFLIQDDELLVELYFDDDVTNGRHVDSKELITTDELIVLERKEQFQTNWASAKTV
ncbi:MAG: hypothetical protein HQL46_00080 [Gammaproteobacteria bacterium]|nr:hypothetical protein [Gammaproteobacteria bacterium]